MGHALISSLLSWEATLDSIGALAFLLQEVLPPPGRTQGTPSPMSMSAPKQSHSENASVIIPEVQPVVNPEVHVSVLY